MEPWFLRDASLFVLPVLIAYFARRRRKPLRTLVFLVAFVVVVTVIVNLYPLTSNGQTELLVAIMGGLFVLITMSVVIQVGSFRLTGRRVFRMAPLQHHFELKGWSEVLVVVRFWIIQGICVIVGLGLFYAGWAADK